MPSTSVPEEMASAIRGPLEDRDNWLDRVESLLVYNRDNRSVLPIVPHEPELATLGADRHTYVIWWDFYAVTEAMNASAKCGMIPEIVFGGPDEDGTVWVKVYKVLDPTKSFCSADCKDDHCPLPVMKVLDRVVWYHLDLQKMLAFDAKHDYRRPPRDDPDAPQPIPSTRDLMGLSKKDAAQKELLKERLAGREAGTRASI